MEKIHKTCMFVCFYVYFQHESTIIYMFHVNFPFSAYFYPHYIIMVKGLFMFSFKYPQLSEYNCGVH